MQNYQLQLDKIIESLKSKPRLLLHSCCGPCSSYVLEYLTKFFDITVYYSNSNIDTLPEFNKRYQNQKKACEKFNAQVLEEKYDHMEFLQAVKGLESEAEGGARCQKCFELRLRHAAYFAALNGFEYICSTLTVSPHKNAHAINEIGIKAAKEHGVRWLVSDFKKRGGYLRSVELSRSLGLYRQSYCGCEFAKGHLDNSTA